MQKEEASFGAETNDNRPRWFEDLTQIRVRYRFALCKCQARRWKDDSVLRVNRGYWQRQLLWALAKMDHFYGSKRRLAEVAVKVGVSKILYEYFTAHNWQYYSESGVYIKNNKYTIVVETISLQ